MPWNGGSWVAADYGAPTTRKRFFLIARCDGRPIVWPEPTHAPAKSPEVLAGKKLPWRSAAEIIDWSPCPAHQFLIHGRKSGRNTAFRPAATPAQHHAQSGKRLDKFVIKAADPFIVPMGYGERDGQAPRVHTSRTRHPRRWEKENMEFASRTWCRVNHRGDFRGQTMEDPLQTITAKHGYEWARPGHGTVDGDEHHNSTGHPVNEPIDTARTGGGGGQMFLGAS